MYSTYIPWNGLYLLGMGWGWGFLALISDKFKTRATQTSLWCILLLQDDRIRSNMGRSYLFFFCSLRCSLTNWVAIRHSLSFVDVASALTVVFNSDRFLGFPMFITKVAFCWSSAHICQYLYILPVFPDHCCQVTPHPSTYVTPISILVSCCHSPLAFLYNFVWQSHSSWYLLYA